MFANLKESIGIGKAIIEGMEKAFEEPKGIILKNIDLTGISALEQSRKVEEERKEFIYAFNDYKNNKSEENKIHAMDELLDEFQTKLGLLEKEGIKAEEVQDYYNTWVKKLDKRPRNKLCSKCINSKHYKLNDDYFLCNGNIKDKGIDCAKECKCYEELEE